MGKTKTKGSIASLRGAVGNLACRLCGGSNTLVQVVDIGPVKIAYCPDHNIPLAGNSRQSVDVTMLYPFLNNSQFVESNWREVLIVEMMTDRICGSLGIPNGLNSYMNLMSDEWVYSIDEIVESYDNSIDYESIFLELLTLATKLFVEKYPVYSRVLNSQSSDILLTFNATRLVGFLTSVANLIIRKMDTGEIYHDGALDDLRREILSESDSNFDGTGMFCGMMQTMGYNRIFVFGGWDSAPKQKIPLDELAMLSDDVSELYIPDNFYDPRFGFEEVSLMLRGHYTEEAVGKATKEELCRACMRTEICNSIQSPDFEISEAERMDCGEASFHNLKGTYDSIVYRVCVACKLHRQMDESVHLDNFITHFDSENMSPNGFYSLKTKCPNCQ